jgi:hypothetical protein
MSIDVERVARAIREEIIRQYREDERGNCPGGVAYYEEHISPYQIATAAIAAMEGWRPIEEAPRDGTFILCALPSGHVTILQYCREGRWRRDVFSELALQPSCWRPLPAPPAP